MNNNEVIAILDGLIETCKTGREEFRNAAESIQNSEFRRLFNIFSQQRVQFISELKSEVHRLGGDSVVEAGSEAEATAPLPSNTIPFRNPAAAKTTMRDEAGIISECQHEEEAAVNDYQEALKADLPLDVQYVVKRQYMDIKDAYDRIRILQRAA
ncbi:MAG TPA: PA2169 family four-helix-bundle protein [Terriglobia bacterium]|jgi:uncharacterized protein (TIGR02284 family)